MSTIMTIVTIVHNHTRIGYVGSFVCVLQKSRQHIKVPPTFHPKTKQRHNNLTTGLSCICNVLHFWCKLRPHFREPGIPLSSIISRSKTTSMGVSPTPNTAFIKCIKKCTCIQHHDMLAQGGGYRHIWAIWICVAVKGGFQAVYSRIGNINQSISL